MERGLNGLLLDTHVLLWTALEAAKLSKRAGTEIEGAAQLYISAITLYEVLYLAGAGRVQLTMEPNLWFQTTAARLELIVLPVNADIAAMAASLPAYPNGDPADRLIVSTAVHFGLPLCTADRSIHAFHKGKPEALSFSVVW